MKNFLTFLLLTFVFIMPGFSADALRTLEGVSIPLAELKGRWIFINYWASWCPTCIDEIKELNHFYTKQKSKALVFAVNYDGLPKAQQIALIKQYNIRYPSLSGDPASDLKLGAVPGLPTTFVINPAGELVKTIYGGQTQKSLSKLIRL